MININPDFESNPKTLEQEIALTETELIKNLEELKLQKTRLETQLAELDLKYIDTEYNDEDRAKKANAETLLLMLNEAIREAEEKLQSKK